MNVTLVKILDESRGRYLLGFTPQSVSDAGWHRLEVRLRHRRAVVRPREGYVAR